MGPQHPSTHGVLRLVVSLKGETVKSVEPHIGYIHRGIEKMCESITYPQIIHLTDRMDYLSAHINNEAVCLTVEKALEVDIPDRVKGNTDNNVGTYPYSVASAVVGIIRNGPGWTNMFLLWIARQGKNT